MIRPFAITLDAASSHSNHTGSWRAERPAYVTRLPPCNNACPAGERVQEWLYHAESGDYERAWRALVRDNPLPAVMGRVCYHTCEDACNRAKHDAAVNIHAVERFLGDEALRRGWSFDIPAVESGKRVLVIGAGPSGLSAAYQLRRAGHAVTIYEAGMMPGGMLRYGIPRYRLPREVLDAEIARIRALGVELVVNRRVEDLDCEMREGGFDAMFLAVGAHIGKRAYIPAGDASRILDAVTFLRGMEASDGPPRLGRRVVVYGGGNTAMDAARTAKRLGASESLVVYRRTREQMPAHEFELEEALEEGITVRWLTTIKEEGGDGTIVVERMELDETGFPRPTGELETIQGDSLILALGQDVDLEFLRNVKGLDVIDGVVRVDANMMTGRAGIFAGGDMVPAQRTVTVAVGHGRDAARHIDAWLCGTSFEEEPAGELARFELLNTWYYADAPKTVQPALDSSRRQSGFEEVVAGLDEETALFEARRCFSCGNCFECDNCFGVCPDNAVVKLGAGRRYEINLDFCKGCGLCAAECPCGGIEMRAETG